MSFYINIAFYSLIISYFVWVAMERIDEIEQINLYLQHLLTKCHICCISHFATFSFVSSDNICHFCSYFSYFIEKFTNDTGRLIDNWIATTSKYVANNVFHRIGHYLFGICICPDIGSISWRWTIGASRERSGCKKYRFECFRSFGRSIWCNILTFDLSTAVQVHNSILMFCREIVLFLIERKKEKKNMLQ